MSKTKLKVVAFGDSLTQGNAIGGAFKNWTELVASELGVDVINAGIGGNTTVMARERFRADVLDKAPDVVLINFGMNDHLLNNEGESFVALSVFEENLIYFVDEIRKINATPVLVTPNYFIEGNDTEYYYSRHPRKAYEPYGGALGRLDIYIDKIRKVAKRMDAGLVDIRSECEKYDPYEFLRTVENSGANDGVHPGMIGVRVYAEMIIEVVRKYI